MALVLFLDESGDHSLSRIDPQYPMFVLCGILVDEHYHATEVAKRLADFKERLFGQTDIILHTADFTRNGPGFERMEDHDFRTKFFSGLEDLIAGVNFKVVACAIRKDEHLKKYGLSAIDPYMLSLSLVVERFIFETGSQGGAIVVESRNETLNNALELAFLDLKIRGTDYVGPSKIRKRVHNFSIREKKENLPGLQLADVVATPIGRHVLGKKTYPVYSSTGDFFDAVKAKFRKDWKGNYEGMGLVVLPK